MSFYKDQENKIHFLDSDSFKWMLPVGSIKITDQEAKASQIAPLPERRQKVIDSLKEKSIEVRGGGILHDGLWYHSDPQSLINYTLMRSNNGDLQMISGWRSMSGATTTMTATLVRRILLAAVEKGLAIDVAYMTHKAAILVSDDPEKYDFRTGWPAVYVPA